MIKTKSIKKVLPSNNAGSSSAKKKTASISQSTLSKLPKYNFGTTMAGVGANFGVDKDLKWKDYTGSQKAGTISGAGMSVAGAGLSMAGGLVSAFDKDKTRFDKNDATSSMLSGVGSGVASGASAGMMFGPWGAAIGGVVGGIAGAIGAGKANDAAYSAQAKSDRIDSISTAAQQASTIGANNTSNNRKSRNFGIPGFNKGVYKFYSNKDNEPNARVASEEAIVSPDGLVDIVPGKYKGKDNTLASIKDGSTILPKDKYFTLPNGKSTPADIGNRVSKIQSKAKEVLGRRNTSSINRRTHELNLENADEILDSVALYAESVRNITGGNKQNSMLPGFKGGVNQFYNIDRNGNPVYSTGRVSKKSATTTGNRAKDEHGTDYARMAFKGKDKGHLNPYFMFDENSQSGSATFSQNNLIPQDPTLNRKGVWRKTEDEVNAAAAKQDGGVQYAAGVLPTSREKRGSFTMNAGKIVPDSLFQSYVRMPGDTVSFAMANNAKTKRIPITYAELKRRSGYDVLNPVESDYTVDEKTKASASRTIDRTPIVKSSTMRADLRGFNVEKAKSILPVKGTNYDIDNDDIEWNYAQNDPLKRHVNSSFEKESKNFKPRTMGQWKAEFNGSGPNVESDSDSNFNHEFDSTKLIRNAAMAGAIGTSLSQYYNAVPETYTPETYTASKYNYRSNLFNQLRDIQAKENIAKYNNRVIGSNAGSASAMNSALNRNTNNAFATAYDSDSRNRMQVQDLNMREAIRVNNLNVNAKKEAKNTNMRNKAKANDIRFAAMQNIFNTLMPRSLSQYDRTQNYG